MPNSLRRKWIGFVILSNIGLLGHLYYYQTPAGLLFGLPEAWVALFLLLAITVVVNSTFAWFYLGKPDLREVFSVRSGTSEG